MQIILWATGETEKLRPLTENIPAPMVPIANRPVMAYTIEMLARQGFKKILVSLYHLGGSIEAYFGDGRRWGVEIDYALQREPWGSAGSLKWAERSITDTFMVIPADILIDLDIEAILAQHRARQSAATIVVHPNGAGRPINLAADGRVLMQESADDPASLFATEVCIFEPQILEMIPVRTSFDQARDLLPALLNAGFPVHGYQANGYYNAVASFPAYQMAQHDSLTCTNSSGHVLDSMERPLEAKRIAEGIWVGRNHVIHPSARLAPPLYIGDNCQIGRDVELGPDVVLGKHVVVDDEATISRSTIFDHTYVGQLVDIDNRIVNKHVMIDVATAERSEVVDEFLLGEAHPALIDSWLRRVWDTAVSLTLLLITLPITLPVALITWLTAGRLIESQTYLGRQLGLVENGRSDNFNTFTMYRFNTHRANNLTRFGRWLTKTDIYRLPELWNVLKGDMSLVGVKPIQLEEAAQITEAWQKQRYEHPAGFTGLWYIQSQPDSELDDILIADAYYVATRTRWGDIKIFWQTPGRWFRRLKN